MANLARNPEQPSYQALEDREGRKGANEQSEPDSLYMRLVDEVGCRDFNKTNFKTCDVSSLDLPIPGTTSLERVKLSDGSEASYRVHIPKDYDPNKPLPVVLMFHGYGRTPSQGGAEKGAAGMEEVTGLSQLADSEGFIAVYPEGNPERSYSWNNGQWFFSGRDDKEMTNKILDTVQEKLAVDKDRIYIVGYSQGGSFTHNIANKLSERVAAVVENAGWMTGKEDLPKRPFPILSIQSRTDDTVPYDGNPWYSITMKPESYTQDFYRRANGIAGEPEVATRVGLDNTKIEEYTWRNSQTGNQVKTMVLNGQGHLWYGGKGAEGTAIDTTREAWNFLKQFRRVER